MKKGFTLLEFLIYIAALTIVLGGAVLFALNLVRNERTFGSKSRIFDDADFAMRQIVDNARLATNIQPDSGSNASKFDNQSSVPCVTNCALSLMKKAASGDPCGATITKFFTNGLNQLIMQEWNGTTKCSERQLVSARARVEGFTVSCVGASPCSTQPKSVAITLRLSDTDNPADTQSIRTSVTPRGY